MNKNISYMKTIIRTIVCLGVLSLAASCQMYEIDTQMTPEKAAASIRMVCDALPSYTVPSTNPGVITFNVSSNTPWTITRSSGAEWCNVTPSSSSAGALISDVVVTCESNPNGEDRSATLTLTAEKVNIPVTITITQDRRGKLFVTPVSQDYAATGGPLSFTIQTNVPWTIRSTESWLSFNRESGNPDPEGRTLTIQAIAEQSNVLERTATVIVTAGDDEETFEVVQKGKFDITEISEEFSGAGSTQVLKIRTDLPWEVSADKGWISFDKETGVGTGATTEVQVTAAPNDGVIRKANITVEAGGVVKTFEVTQMGAVFEIIAPEDPVVAGKGGDLLIEVRSSLAWEPSTKVEGWTVTKADDSHVKLTAAYNSKFAAKKGDVTVTSATGNELSVEITQDVNFTFEGSYEVLSDGSVKVMGGKPTRVTTKDAYRYVKAELKLKECHFAEKGELWFTGAAGGCNIYNQLTVGGKTRTRTDGNIYKSTDFSISLDELNAMTTYGVNLLPAEDPTKMTFQFLYNGEVRGEQEGGSPFAGNTDETQYWFGFWNDGTADTWYIVESCTITPVEG